MGRCSCCGSDSKVGKFEAPGDEDQIEFTGPLEHRECHDIIFLIIFLAFLAGLGVIIYFAVIEGNPYRLIRGVDSYGNVCQQLNDHIPNVKLSGQDTTNKPYVFFFDPTYFASYLPNTQYISFNKDNVEIICVEKCPNRTVEVIDFYTEDNVNLCLYDVTPYVDNITQCPATPVGKQVSIFNRCIPEYIVLLAKSVTTSFASIFGAVNMGINIPQKIASDFKNTWREMGYLATIAVSIALLIVVLMRILATVIVWTIVMAVMCLSLSATTYCWYSWYRAQTAYRTLPENAKTKEASNTVDTWLIYAGIVSGVTAILLLILLVLRKRISLVVQLFKEAGKAIGCMPTLLFQPFWTLTLLIASVGALGLVAMFIETAGLPTVIANGHVKYEMGKYWEYVRWYNLFATLWLSAFIIDCQDIVVAGAVATWYFTRNKKKLCCPIMKSTMRLIRYHIGSVVFGSFIIAVVRLARIILAFIEAKLQGKAGKLVDFIMKCLQCCLWCFEKFLRYMNRNAYIEIAIYGYSFCQAGQKAFMMLVSNVLRVTAINSIGSFVLFLGKVLTVVVIIIVGNEMLKDRDDINYIWVPISVACAFGYCVSHCFLLIYEITIDTIFLCFCEDCKRNDGSASRPYFMSKNLMTCLDQKSK